MNNSIIKKPQLLLLILLVALFPVHAAPVSFFAYKIVNTTQVNLYSQPILDENKANNILHTLTLGTIGTVRKRTENRFTIGDQTDYWYYIEINDDIKGWLFGSFLTSYTSKNRESTYLDILQRRMDKQRYTFNDMVASYRLIDRILATIIDHNNQARLKLHQLLALQKSLDMISPPQYTISPYQQWLQQHKKRIIFDKTHKRWLITAKTYWNLADYYANHATSDQLSWYAASVPLIGECKATDTACHLQKELATTAAYLQRSPGGAYVNSALLQLRQTLNNIITHVLNANAHHFHHTPTRIEQNLKALTQIVKRSSANAPNRPIVLAQLQTLQTHCHGR